MHLPGMITSHSSSAACEGFCAFAWHDHVHIAACPSFLAVHIDLSSRVLMQQVNVAQKRKRKRKEDLGRKIFVCGRHSRASAPALAFDELSQYSLCAQKKNSFAMYIDALL